MNSSNKKFKDIDEYIDSFPKDVKKILIDIRRTVKNAAPMAREKISYGMPSFTLNGNLVYFAAFKNHIGFYPMPKPIKVFRKELSSYKTSKGAIQFPIDKKIPLSLITRIVKFRAKENLKKTNK